MPGELAIIGHQRLAGAAFVDSGRVWFVLAPVVLLIVFLYFLLFVIFPNTDKRVRRSWAICIPLALILMAVDVLFPFDQYTFRGLDALVLAFALMLFVAPMVLIRRPHERQSWLRGRNPMLALVAVISPALLTHVLRVYFPTFWHSEAFTFVLIAYGTFVLAYGLVRWQSGPRVR